MAGLYLDDWQKLIIRGGHGLRPDGKLSAAEVGVCVPRQNGKGGILEAVELGRLFVLGSPLTIHSAHQFDTSLEAYRRLRGLIENCPDLERRVKKPGGFSNAHGNEGITLADGPRIRFRTRTKGGGRGFSCECLILDEAMYLPDAMMAALVPTISAKEYGQIWYTGSAVDQASMDDGLVFAAVRARGIAGDDPELAYYEWSVDQPNPEDVDDEIASDPDAWAGANPALGIRISAATVSREKRSLSKRAFAVERLNVGDWPSLDGAASIIDQEAWAALTDPLSQMRDPVFMAFDVSPDRSRASISAAGYRADGLLHIEVIDAKRGTGWVADRIIELVSSHKPADVLCDSASPAKSLVPELEKAGVTVETTTTSEHAQACGMLFDAVEQGKLRHLGTPELDAAVRGAATRPLGDSWAWSRKNSLVDITPLVACTIAGWAASSLIPKRSPQWAFS